jgi:O-6-methylguanine DNA methyltransferase
MGSPFQKQVWNELTQIPFGETLSYSNLAAKVSKPSARRAVAQANGANLSPIIIPCHRIINADGKIGGYSGGIERKKWLLAHEKRFS